MTRWKLLIGLLISLCAWSWAAPGKTVSVVSGWVRVSSESENGEVQSVEIVVGEEGQEDPYLVLPGPQGDKLKEVLGEYVVASGTVTEDELGWKTIEVTRFNLVDELPQPEPGPDSEQPAPAPSP